MKNLLVLILLIWLNQSIALCQTEKDVYYLDITAFSKNVQLTDPNFSIKEVIDGAEVRGDFGFVQTGLLNKYRKVIFRSGLEKAIFKYVNHRYYDNPYAIPIKMEVLTLAISERSSFTEKGRVTLRIRYYRDDEIITSYQHQANHKTFFGDITKRNIRTLDKMLNESLNQLSKELRNI